MRGSGKYSAIRLLGALLFVLALFVPGAEGAATEPTGKWRLDGTASADLPRSFRLMTDSFSEEAGISPARTGLDPLRISASGQPSYAALAMLNARLRAAAGAGDIWMVDLRQESHGYVNHAYPVSWHKQRNWANYGMTAAQIERDEIGRLAALLGSRTTFEPMGRYDTAHFEAVMPDVVSVTTEKEAAERAGFKYVRISAADQAAPSDAAIDDFVRFVAGLPENAWLHLHCHAGHGRTTTFAVFYDIMKNPGVPLETIVARQYALGGTNLFAPAEGDDWRDRERRKRADVVRAFYVYANENRADGFRTAWSRWKRGKITL